MLRQFSDERNGSSSINSDKKSSHSLLNVDDEIGLWINSYLSFAEQHTLFGGLNRRFSQLGKKDLALKYAYQAQLSTVDYQSEQKALLIPEEKCSINRSDQMTALFLYHQANHEKDCVMKDFAFKKLFGYLTQHIGKSWSSYYWGVMHLYGMGVVENQQKGITYLRRAVVRAKDFRAAQILGAKLCDPSEEGSTFRSQFNFEDCQLILASLLDCFKNHGIHEVAREIGYMYLSGLTGAIYPEKAEVYFFHAFKVNQDLEAVDDLVKFYKDFAPNRIDGFLQFAYKRMPHPRIANLIGNDFADRKENALALEWYLRAFGESKDAQSAFSIANLYFSGVHPEGINRVKAKHYLEHAFANGLCEVAKDIAKNVTNGNLPSVDREEKKINEEVVSWYKRGFHAGDVTAANELVDNIYSLDKTWAQDPKKVWWMLISAQKGGVVARDHLLVAAKGKSIYARFAYHLFSNGESGSQFTYEDLNHLQPFVNAGREEKLLTEEFEKLLASFVADEAEEKCSPSESKLRI